jgi:hypothetical protein
MLIETVPSGKYQIVRVLEDLTFHHNPSKIRHIVSDLIERGFFHIALSFTPDTYPSSRLISMILTCSRMLKEHSGQLAIITADDNMRETYEILMLAHDDCFRIVKTAEEL